MAHSVNCKLIQSYRQWHSFQNQPLHKDCRRLRVTCANGGLHSEDAVPMTVSTRRALLQTGPALMGMHLMLQASPAEAIGFQKDMNRRRGFKAQIPEDQYQAGPQGLKYYDMTPGKGTLPKKGDRITVHYELRWHGVTFMTSRCFKDTGYTVCRQGMGVTGGEPLGFNIGAQGPGGTLPGLDLAVQAGEGMRVGGARKAILPPELGYGERGIGEVPGGAVLELDVELLSVKTSPFGARVKLVEG